MSEQAIRVRPYVAAPVQSRRSRAATQFLWVVLCAGALTAAAMFRPDPRGLGTHEQLGFPPCSFHRLTGVPCPGCGMTTAFAHTVRLQFAQALRANLFGTLLCVSASAFGVFSLVCLLTDWRAWFALNRLLSPVVLWSAFGLLLASWGIKILATVQGWWEAS